MIWKDATRLGMSHNMKMTTIVLLHLTYRPVCGMDFGNECSNDKASGIEDIFICHARILLAHLFSNVVVFLQK